MTEDQAGVCARIMAESSPWTTLGRAVEDTHRLVTDPNVEAYVALAPDEQVIGLVLIRMIPVFKGYISTLAVHERWRNRGIGKLLLQFAEQRIFRDSPNVFLCCSSFNIDAMRFYERMGYTRIGEIKDFIIAGADEFLMRKTIGPVKGFQPA